MAGAYARASSVRNTKLARLPELDAPARTADGRDECRPGARVHWKLETELAQNLLNPFGIRMFGTQIHQRCARRRRARWMRRLSPVDEKRDDPVGKGCDRQPPCEQNAFRRTSAARIDRPELDTLAQRVAGQRFQVATFGRPRYQLRRRQIIDAKAPGPWWFWLFGIRSDDLEVRRGAQCDQRIACAGTRMLTARRCVDAQQPLQSLHPSGEVGCRIDKMIDRCQKTGGRVRLLP